MNQGSFVGWLTAWILMFVMLFILSRSRSGHTIIYYGAWLLVVLLLVTQSGQIVAVLKGGNF